MADRREYVLWVIALLVGLAAPFVAFNLGYFNAGTLMLLGSFALMALGLLWAVSRG